MSAPLPRELTLLCSAAAVMLGACASDSTPNDVIDPAPRDAGSALNTGDAGAIVDAGTPDSGVERDGGLANLLCPPAEPFGIREGDVLPDLQLYDCDGNPVSLQSQCERRASHFFIMAGW